MDDINISHRRIYEGIVIDFSSELDDDRSVKNILREEGSWRNKSHESTLVEHFTVDLEDILPINIIELVPGSAGTFPSDFRIEGSPDGTNWTIISSEKNLKLDDSSYTLFMPILHFRYIKVLIFKPLRVHHFQVELSRLILGIAGIQSIVPSSPSYPDHDIYKLFDSNSETYWETSLKPMPEKEIVEIDFGHPFHINKLILVTTSLEPNGFPEHLTVEISTDKKTWTTLYEEKNVITEPGTRYCWDTSTALARYVRLEMMSFEIEKNKFGIRLAGMEIYAAPNTNMHTHTIGTLTPYASIFNPGMVKLAKDGEDMAGTALQASDRRLRDATTIFKGIVQLAENGDVREGLAVQSSDQRLKPATDLQYGIVRFAYDREDHPATAVQGSDSRLKEATETSFGIVKLCPDNVYSELSVVQGNDSRLQKATTSSFGICRIAQDGEKSSDCVIAGNDRRLRDATTTYPGIVELAEDGEDKPDVVVQGNDKRLKNATTVSRGIVELAEDGEDKPDVVVQGNDKRLKNATTVSRGIVELAENGEDKPDIVVQGNDKRLKDATETRKGILIFAKDGESAPLKAVQANDRRLRDATTTYRGIVELAEDGEDKPDVVVQGNDKRLKDATTASRGIVELAEDGEDRPDVVVQGNDKRLKDATETRKGILIFAKDGESAPLKAVQANDRRLRDATTTYRGIAELAEDGEDKPGVVVQGNDKRLKYATTASRGIVELAEDGEDTPGVVVQGNDRRLRAATCEQAGIVRLSPKGEERSGFVVQSDDPRLSDARKPIAHTHHYAPLEHDFNSHRGTLKIIDDRSEPFEGITPPSDNASIVYAKNRSQQGSVGVLGVIEHSSDESSHSYGIVGHSPFIGVRGQSAGNPESQPHGCGVLGISRFGPGGVFASEHGSSLIVDGFGTIADFDNTIHLIGDGNALQVKGSSEFTGTISIKNRGTSPENIVEMFAIDEEEYVSPGDILVVSVRGNAILARSRSRYNRSVIGIVSGNPTVIFKGRGEKHLYPIALTGTTLCKVDAREKPIKPGDLIVTSDTPGCGMAGTIDTFEKIGSVIGKALSGIDDGIATIPVFITHL